MIWSRSSQWLQIKAVRVRLIVGKKTLILFRSYLVEPALAAHSKHDAEYSRKIQERRSKRIKLSSTKVEKMVTRNRGVRTTSYRGGLVRPRRKNPSKRASGPSKTIRFHGVVLPSGRRSTAVGRNKRKVSPDGAVAEQDGLAPV
jgi:hypothetical protein